MLIFDGDCGFCTTAATWIESKWPNDSAEIAPWQRLGDQLDAWGLTRDDVMSKAWWVDDRGVRGGERAVAAALQLSPGWPRFVGRVIDVPPLRWLAKPGYRLVARYRYRLPGSTPACRL